MQQGDGRTPGAARRALRLVTARRGAPATGLVRFHPRLTILTGFGDDASRWLAELLGPGRSSDTIVALDHKQLPVNSVPPAVVSAQEPVLTATRLQRLLADRALDSQRELRARAEELGRRIAEVQALRKDLTRRRARLEEQLHGPASPGSDADDAALVEVFLDAEANALADELDSLEQELALARPRDVVRSELATWEQVAEEARVRLARCRDASPTIDPAHIAEATRLRSDWRYSEQAAKSARRRRSRREADEHRSRYEAFLARFGASSFEDLAVIGTGFGSTDADIAIREAATVVSMAEQQCAALRAELDAPGADVLVSRKADVLARTEALLGRPPGREPGAELRSRRPGRAVAVEDPVGPGELRDRLERTLRELERTGIELQALERESGAIERARLELADRATKGLASLGPVAIEALLTSALADRRAPVTCPLFVDDILRSLAPRARRRAFDMLAKLSRSRQVVLVSDSDEVSDWVAELAAEDVMVWTAQQAEEACA